MLKKKRDLIVCNAGTLPPPAPKVSLGGPFIKHLEAGVKAVAPVVVAGTAFYSATMAGHVIPEFQETLLSDGFIPAIDVAAVRLMGKDPTKFTYGARNLTNSELSTKNAIIALNKFLSPQQKNNFYNI